MLLQRFKLLTCNTRKISTSMIRYDGHGRPGLPGENFPLNLDMGKYKMTLFFTFFFGLPLGAPWLVVMQCMTK